MEKKRVFDKKFAIFFIGLVLLTGMALAIPEFDDAFVGHTFNLTEDSFFSYNFSQNVTDPQNGTWNFSVAGIVSDSHASTSFADYPWMTLNTTSGNLSINATRTNETGFFNISLRVEDETNAGESRNFFFNVTAVNDAPIFTNLGGNRTLNQDRFELILNSRDEEEDIGFVYNVSFDDCPGGAPCSSLFSLVDFNDTATNISFVPGSGDKGNWTIRFNVTDSNETGGALRSEIRTWELLWNENPYFISVCDEDRDGVEGQEFTCYINVSDPDGAGNWTLTSNYSWFTFNNSGNEINVTDSDGNFSVLVNLTAGDAEVGNFSVNLTVQDDGSGSSIQGNSTLIYFFFDNINDSVNLLSVSNLTVFNSSTNVSFNVNATDDDLLIVDKSVYNESLTFNVNVSSINVGPVSLISNTNISSVTLNFDPNDLGEGNHTVNISVNDSNGFSQDSQEFVIEVINNNAPIWTVGTQVTHALTEGQEFYLNLSQNVTDSDAEAIEFNYFSSNSFPSFDLNETTGIVNFTSNDVDVGEHIVEINATDQKINVSLSFNFTISNVNETPHIQDPLTTTLVINASVDSLGDINGTEDNVTTLEIRVEDEDFRIPEGQKGFYNESLSFVLSIEGPNVNLFNFTAIAGFPTPGNNLSRYRAIFTPNKTDVGEYNISINFSDSSGESDLMDFNLTILETVHSPSLISLTNQSTKANVTLYYDINSTDVEDRNDSFTGGNLTYNYTFVTGSDFILGNETRFNSSSGVLNMEFNDSQVGSYRINISVNDSSGLLDSGLLDLFVYDSPNILGPPSSFVFNLTEGIEANLSMFVTNHTAGNNLTYLFYLNGSLKSNLSLASNGNNVTWLLTPNFTDETLGLYEAINLTVINPDFPELNVTTGWNANISHANAPVNFTSNIPNQSISGTSGTVNLSLYLSDPDFNDVNYNQTVNFTVYSNASNASSITASVSSDWILTLIGSVGVKETINISVEDLNSSSNLSLSNDTSNNFEVSFSATSGSSSPSSSGGGGGGGGGGSSSSVVVELDLPEPVFSKKQDRLVIPVSVVNKHSGTISGISLGASVSFLGLETDKVSVSFDKTEISTLAKDGEGKVNLIANVDTEVEGTYTIKVDVSVGSPVYQTSGKVFIEVDEGKKIEERIVFAEEFVIGNPECLEIKELVDDAKELFDQGSLEEAEEKVDEAIEGCRRVISGQSRITGGVIGVLGGNVFGFVGILSAIAIILGIGYYSYKRYMLMKALRGY